MEVEATQSAGRVDDLSTAEQVLAKSALEGGGRELVERVTQLYPEIRVLFMSGYTDDVVWRSGVFAAEYLQKPFTRDVLLQKVRAVLDAKT